MKRIVTLLLSCVALATQASDTLQVESKITDVTVFFSGATVSRTLDVDLPKGQHYLMVPDLITRIDPVTVQLKMPDGLSLLSMKYFEHPAGKAEKKRSKIDLDLEAIIRKNTLKIERFEDEIEALELEEKMLITNSDLTAKSNGTSLQEIRETTTYLRSRLVANRSERLGLYEERGVLLRKNTELRNELNRMRQRSRPTGGELLIHVESETRVSDAIVLSYFVESAAWVPGYEFRVDDTAQPMSIVYKADISQSTGEDWDQVKLTLSATNPRSVRQHTERKKWDVMTGTPYRADVVTAVVRDYAELRGTVRDVGTGEVLPFVQVTVKQDGRDVAGALSDFDGNYVIHPLVPGLYDIYYSFVGYDTFIKRGARLNPSVATVVGVQMSSGVMLDAVEVIQYQQPLIDRDGGASGSRVRREDIQRIPGRDATHMAQTVSGVASASTNGVSIRGSRHDDTWIYVDGVKVRGSSALPRSAHDFGATYRPEASVSSALIAENIRGDKRQGLGHVEYALDQAYTIRSDGQAQTLRVRDARVEVDYRYVVTPVADPAVFLHARFSGWETLNLMPGKVNIVYQNVYKGQVEMDPAQFSDTLIVSLGQDHEVLVKREENITKAERKVFSSGVRERVAYTVSVRNTKPLAIALEVQDQIPVSSNRSVSVDLIESADAVYDEAQGYLTWVLEVPPNSGKDVEFAYSVRTPR